MDDFYYRKLKVYHQSKTMVIMVYDMIRKFPKNEDYALCDQLRHAAISVPSNIAEGMGRFSLRERIHFIEIAYASLMEVMCQLEISVSLGYISEEEFIKAESIIAEIAKMLSGLKKALSDKQQYK